MNELPVPHKRYGAVVFPGAAMNALKQMHEVQFPG